MIHLVNHGGERRVVPAGSGWKISHDALQQFLHAHTLFCGAEQHGEQLPLCRAVPQSLFQPFRFHRPILQIRFRQFVVVFGGAGERVLPEPFGGEHPAVLRAFALHLLHREEMRGTFLPQLFQHAGQIAAYTVRLVDQQQDGDAHLFQRPP